MNTKIYTNELNPSNYVLVQSNGGFLVFGGKVHSKNLMTMIDFGSVVGWSEV